MIRDLIGQLDERELTIVRFRFRFSTEAPERTLRRSGNVLGSPGNGSAKSRTRVEISFGR